jgi:putative membrane protein insertion efficiency factor
VTSSRSSESVNADRRHKGRRIRWVLAAFLLLIVWDLSRAPERQWGAGAALSAIRFYQLEISHLRPGFGSCRLRPTCSNYGHQAIVRFGLLRGSSMTAWRLLRCGPWTAKGTVDYPGLERGQLPPSEESVDESGDQQGG